MSTVKSWLSLMTWEFMLKKFFYGNTNLKLLGKLSSGQAQGASLLDPVYAHLITPRYEDDCCVPVARVRQRPKWNVDMPWGRIARVPQAQSNPGFHPWWGRAQARHESLERYSHDYDKF